MHVIKKHERIESRWKNGGGTTFEIERAPVGKEAYDWRLSQAAVTSDGPFSLFPGYDRWLVIWSGDGLKLGNQTLLPLVPYRFSGDLALTGTLIGTAVTDIGLIFNRARIDARMAVCTGLTSLHPATHYLIARIPWTYSTVNLDEGDTLKLDVSMSVELTLPAQTLVVSIDGAR